MKSITTIVAILLCAISGFAQQQFISAQNYYDLENKEALRINAAISNFHWNTLPGKIPVIYSKGYLVRAQTLRNLVEQCIAFYQPIFSKTQFDLSMVILDSSDRHKIHLDGAGPSSLPEINKLFIGAEKQMVAKGYGEVDNSADDQISRFDCTALHELGHIFLQSFNNTFTGNLWADEFLASYFAICFFEQHKIYPGLPQVGETGYTPKYKTLTDFERLYFTVGGPNYGWYQAQFQNLGYELYPKLKTSLINKFIENASSDGKKIDPLDLLKQLAPATMNQWLKRME